MHHEGELPPQPEPADGLTVESVVRGVAMAVAAISALAVAGRGLGGRSWLRGLVAPPMLLAALLLAWAAAIHLSGGERRDDHPYV